MNALKSDIYSAAVHSGMRSIAALSYSYPTVLV